MHAARLTRLLLCLILAGLIGASAAAARGGLGDPFFPRSGNPGYDVSHYDARLAYRPSSGKLDATATIDATASRHLRRLSLDLEGLWVTTVTVNGGDAGFARGDGKLTVTPGAPLPSGQPFTVTVDYEGRPHHIVDADGTAEGWEQTSDGAAALGEPLGTATWLPCNNTLTDKAGFDFHITVPEQLKGVGNGRLLSVTRAGSTKTFDWRESQPMAPYLATIDIGRGSLARSEIAGVPAWTMLDPRVEKRSRQVLAALPEIIRFESGVFGPYPFDAAGAIVDVTPRTYALEAQTRPIFSQPPDLTTLVHEMAHQWFGDSVGLKRWPDIWLNEGFATWAQWYYAERHGGPSALQTFRSLYRFPASKQRLWDPPPGHPGNPANLFAGSVYLRGAMALEALRIKVGTKPMLRTLRRWTTEHRYGNADIAEFIALAEQVSGRRLEPLFNRWLYRPGKPPGSTARPFETRSRASQLTRLRSASPVAAT